MMLLNKHFTLTLGLLISMAFNMAYADQACVTSIKNKWPHNRYTDHNNGTVTDTITGLMWMQCSAGQASASNTCTGAVSTYTWTAALDLANNETFASHNDWRLPNVKELSTLVARNCYTPAINQTLFPNTPANGFWTSSPSSTNSSSTRYIDFDQGDDEVNYVSNYAYAVRLVRLGQ